MISLAFLFTPAVKWVRFRSLSDKSLHQRLPEIQQPRQGLGFLKHNSNLTVSRLMPLSLRIHDDVIKWKHFPRHWPFVRGIHRWPVNSPHKGQWRGALVFSLICVRTNARNNLRRHYAHDDVIVMYMFLLLFSNCIVRYISNHRVTINTVPFTRSLRLIPSVWIAILTSSKADVFLGPQCHYYHHIDISKIMWMKPCDVSRLAWLFLPRLNVGCYRYFIIFSCRYSLLSISIGIQYFFQN